MKKLVSVLLVLVLSIASIGCFAEETVSEPEYIGIISAMKSEKLYLLEQAEIEYTVTYGTTEYHVGTLCGKNVVICSAGVGKSYAAAGAALMLDNFNISDVIFTGIAGGVGDETKVLDIVVSTDLVMHDYGQQTNDGFVWNAKWTEDGRIPADAELAAKAYEAAVEVVGEENAHMGTIATGDQFVGSEVYVAYLQEMYNAIACEMEGCAVALICWSNNVPFVVIRAMSDKADGLAHASMDNFGGIAADNSGKIVCALLGKM